MAASIPLPYTSCLSANKALDLPLISVVSLDVLQSSSVSFTSTPAKLGDPVSVITSDNVDMYRIFPRSPENILYGLSISTYPSSPSTDIICDTYMGVVYPSLIQLAIADGCNWGMYPALAASNAVSGFILSMKEYLEDTKEETSHTIASALLRGIHQAHQQILTGHEEYLRNNPDIEPETPAGTTTLLGGVVIPSNPRNENDPTYLAIFVSLGDCKCYRKSKKDGSLIDLTRGLRPQGLQRADPGGRLGPYESGQCDTRNLKLIMAGLEIGDSLILMTDGVHDNFDPQQLGYDSSDFGYKNWEDIGSSDSLDLLKVDIAKKRFFTPEREYSIEPKEIAEELVRHCVVTTESTRNYMSENPNRRQPRDYKQCPGKMDHTTCLVFTLPPLHQLSEAGEKGEPRETSIPTSTHNQNDVNQTTPSGTPSGSRTSTWVYSKPQTALSMPNETETTTSSNSEHPLHKSDHAKRSTPLSMRPAQLNFAHSRARAETAALPSMVSKNQPCMAPATYRLSSDENRIRESKFSELGASEV